MNSPALNFDSRIGKGGRTRVDTSTNHRNGKAVSATHPSTAVTTLAGESIHGLEAVHVPA